MSRNIMTGVKNNNYILVTTAYVMVKVINSGGIFYLIFLTNRVLNGSSARVFHIKVEGPKLPTKKYA